MWKRLTLGGNVIWKSKVLACDYFLVDERSTDSEDLMDVVRNFLFGDLNFYWKENINGYFTVDLLPGIDLTRSL